ncbi:SDR family oxidoreductase [Mucilaginibacter ginsenosidivorax]|uniref:SDR family oxidoreductase n=1 Tax=Mucilaginibacter ginsenosidivorax TaxID=862126 RepID=A0A5B8W4M6_9SPHI|nr:SDR family oxidoreductase [Mucilaginibacter ginsenosidivorax]QEC78499.1 SDR family oxidoreductase [Mucilaginibacter ginsenosidivorax]
MESTAAFQHKNTISILGCGWFGLALAKALISDGIRVKGSTTSEQKIALLANEGIAPYLVNFSADEETYNADFFDCDVLFIAIPPKARSGAGAEFIPKIQRILSAIRLHHVKKVIFISSTTVYADLNCEVDEHTPPLPDTESGKILLEAENLFKNAPAFQTTIIRFAGLIGPGRNPGRFFAGKKNIPNGNAPVNLIHLDDCIGISKAIIIQDAFGCVFNGCLPQHPLKSAFYAQAAVDAGLEKPEFIDELKEWKIVKSVNVEEILGYQFRHTL